MRGPTLSESHSSKPEGNRSVERSAFYPPTDVYTRLPTIAEILDMDLDAGKIDSSTLTLRIETPDGRRAKTEFDLQTLR